MGKSVIGGTPYAVEARPAASTGIAWSDWCASGYPASASCIRIRVFALTPFIQGRSRMREIRSYGSVRGVVGDRYPYRDSQNPRMPARTTRIGFATQKAKTQATNFSLSQSQPKARLAELRAGCYATNAQTKVRLTAHRSFDSMPPASRSEIGRA